MKKKKALATLTAAILLASMLAGCSGNQNNPEAAATPASEDAGASTTEAEVTGEEPVAELKSDGITVAVSSGDYVTFVNENIVPVFNEKYPDVPVTVIPDDNIEEQIASGDYPNVYNGGFGARGMRYANAGILVPLNNFEGYDELAARIDPAYMTQFADYNFYIPWNLTTTMMVYNKDLFVQAGLDPENPPETMAEFLDAAKKISDLGSDTYGTIFWNEALGWGGWYWDMLAPIYYNFNQGQYQLMNATGTDIVFDKPEANMTEFLSFLKEAQQYAPASMNDEYTFFGRKIGMWLQFGYGWKADLKSAADEPMVIGEDIGIAPIPVLNEGDTPYSTLGGNGLIIFKSTEDEQKLSWEFIKIMMQEDLNMKACETLGQLPSLTALKDNDFFKGAGEVPFVDQTKTALQPEPFAESDTIANSVLQAIQAVVVSGDTSPEDAIKKAAEDSRVLLQ